MMEYEWDEAKNQSNIRKHGLSFDMAEQVFDEFHLTLLDSREDYGEQRYITLGALCSRPVVIVHTPRSNSTRIISMRKANGREQQIYYQKLKEAGLDL